MLFEKSLLDWYRVNRRHMPWREDPTPYHVYLSEIMLQQTQVDTVTAYYLRFLEKFPTIKKLSEASEEEVLKLWEGLGYYSRGRNLYQSAKIIERDFHGEIPSNKKDLLALPGVGPYTSKAVLSIAFHQKEIAVDGNLIRVYSRLEEKKEINPEKMKSFGEGFFLMKLQQEDPSSFNQALMDLGELVCLPRGLPLCPQCPLGTFCKARNDGTMMDYPPAKKAKEKRKENLTVYVLTYRGRIAIRQRKAEGLLASLYEFPYETGKVSLGEAGEKLSRLGYGLKALKSLGQAKHTFSHLIWEMQGFQAELTICPTLPGLLWVDKNEILLKYPIPSAFSFFKKKIISK
jgi:A/G-specific adenine glycosylase